MTADVAKICRIRRDPNANILAGAFGGLCSVVVGYPFDLIKVRLQTRNVYSGALDCARKTVTHEGFFALYRGMSGLVAFALPRFAIIFHANALGKQLYTEMEQGRALKPDRVNYTEVIFAGLFSQVVIVPLLVSPVERIKVLMQTNSQHATQRECIRYLISKFGLSSLYKGTMLTYARDMPSFGVYFLTYEWMRTTLGCSDGTTTGGLRTLLAGGVAGVAGWFIAIPMDVIKNRHQAVLEKSPSWPTVTDLYRREGFAGFYRGAVPILLRAFPANAAAFFGYEAAILAIAKVSI